MKKEINAEDIIRYMERGNWATSFDVGVTEFCPYHENRRIDMFFFRRWNRETKGYEIKVNRKDFLSDKKWQEYLKFCTWFSFVAPKGVIKKEELPDKIGLVEVEVIEIEKENWVYPTEDYYVEEGQKRYRFEKKIIKRAKRLRDKIEEKDYISLLEGLLIKLAYNKNIMKLTP